MQSVKLEKCLEPFGEGPKGQGYQVLFQASIYVGLIEGVLSGQSRFNSRVDFDVVINPPIEKRMLRPVLRL